MLSVWALSLYAQAGEASEYRIKAAYLYKVLGYVQWPESAFQGPDTPIRIALIGAHPMADELLQVVGERTVKGRKLSVTPMRGSEPLTGFHVVFIGRSETHRLPGLLTALAASPVLIVTEVDGALEQGSVINFVVADNRVRFEVSVKAAERNQLKVSSRLLAVAQRVEAGAD